MNCLKKPFLAKKAIFSQKTISNLAKVFWAKKTFLAEKPKSINLTQDFSYRKFLALFSRNLSYSRRKEEKLTMMHFEALLSSDDLLAI